METKKKILVIGDVMLDTYFSGDINRISPEAPVPVYLKRGERHVLGGAANVAANLKAAEKETTIISLIGDDTPGRLLKEICNEKGIFSDLVVSRKRKTTEKTRLLASNNQQVLRVDTEESSVIDETIENDILTIFEKNILTANVVLISDYNKGLLTNRVLKEVINRSNQANIPVLIDVKGRDATKYKDSTLLKPNLSELHELTGCKVESIEQIIQAAKELKEKTCCKYVLTTCGSRGMILLGEGEPYIVEANCKEVFDVTGAGDTVIAYIAACISNGLSMKKAVDIANIAAGVQISKVGTSCVTWPEIKEIMKRNKNFSKIINREDLSLFREQLREKKIVFTNGCFDILHVGHIRYLKQAAELGDVLVVAVNSDESVKRLKGNDRPINTLHDRIEMLEALDFIDYIITFEEDTPLEIIKRIKPDYLVKGADYENKFVAGEKELKAYGGKMVFLPFVDGKSTTDIINKIRK